MPRLSWDTIDSSSIDEISATSSPRRAGEYRWLATAQKTTPRPDVVAVVAISARAVLISESRRKRCRSPPVAAGDSASRVALAMLLTRRLRASRDQALAARGPRGRTALSSAGPGRSRRSWWPARR